MDIQLEQHQRCFPFFPSIYFNLLCKNEVSIGVWIYIWVFNLIPSIRISYFTPIPCDFYCHSSVAELEIWSGDTPGSSFIVQDCFSLPEFVNTSFKCSFCCTAFNQRSVKPQRQHRLSSHESFTTAETLLFSCHCRGEGVHQSGLGTDDFCLLGGAGLVRLLIGSGTTVLSRLRTFSSG